MKEFERSKEQVNLYEDILKYIECKKADGMKYSDAIKEVNDIVKHVEASINTVLNNPVYLLNIHFHTTETATEPVTTGKQKMQRKKDLVTACIL